MTIPTLPGVTARTVTSPRLSTRVLFSGPEGGVPVIFLHGNVSTATFWEEIMVAMPDGFRGIAPDQRGYGGADPNEKIDATQGLGDLAVDLAALMDTLDISNAHVVGHSAGGNVLWRFMMEFPERILSVTLAAPGSPYGFGGTQGLEGKPNSHDFAGSGGGTVNPHFAPMLEAGERGTDDPGSPRNVMNTFYLKPPARFAREEDLLSSMLATHVGEQDYPGDMVASENWPNVAPGVYGMVNALSPKYAADPGKLLKINPKPPVLWVRGADDQIVSDNSMFDMATLGKMGLVPGYPGEETHPPQPMIGQVRAVLEKYGEAGGEWQEVVIADAGHTPYLEKPDEFNAAFHAHLQQDR